MNADCCASSIPRPDFPNLDGFAGTYSLTTKSESCFQFLRTSLQQCLRDHRNCRVENINCWAPTRLIDVSYLKLNSDRILVVETISLPSEDRLKASRYLTFSHSWGKTEFLRLLSANLKSFCTEGIQVTSLRLSFQDAIYTTRELGCRYIWIDSLCIIQDSMSDWESEARMMQKVYSLCECNIAASLVSDIQDSIFRNSDARAMEPVQVLLNWSSGKQDVMRVSFPWLAQGYNIGPISRRGWVM